MQTYNVAIQTYNAALQAYVVALQTYIAAWEVYIVVLLTSKDSSQARNIALQADITALQKGNNIAYSARNPRALQSSVYPKGLKKGDRHLTTSIFHGIYDCQFGASPLFHKKSGIFYPTKETMPVPLTIDRYLGRLIVLWHYWNSKGPNRNEWNKRR